MQVNPITDPLHVDVIIGVPQGTVRILGPLLFLASINDQPEAVVHLNSRLFADDCLVYRLVRSVADTMRLQEDLEALENRRSLQVLALIRNIFHFLFSFVH